MSDQPQAVKFQGTQQPPAGQPGQPQQPQQPAGQGSQGQPQPQPEAGTQPAQPEYITRQEAARLAAEAADTAFRRAQSLFDKGNEKVRQRLGELESAWDMQAQAGAPVPEEVKMRLRQQVLTAPQAAPPTTEQAAAQPQQPQSGGQDPITLSAWEMIRSAGIEIKDDDPEMQQIKTHGTPYEFLATVAQAIEAKRQRVASTNSQPNGGQAQPQQPGRLPTAVGGQGSYNPNAIADITDPRELLKMAREKGEL